MEIAGKFFHSDDVFMLGPIVASQLPDDFDKRSKEEKA